MRHLLDCRRTFVAVLAIGVLGYLGHLGTDVAGSIAFVVAAVAGANAGEKVFKRSSQEMEE